MVEFKTSIRVRYAETDKMGYVYYGNYATFCEVGRTELMRSLGLTYRQLEEDGYMLPIITHNAEYLGPAFYDDELNIVTSIKEKPGIKVKFEYLIYNDNKLIHRAVSELAFINAKTYKPIRPPKYFNNLIDTFFE
jgi:acyl-CoA thioester hydrolase